MKIDVNYKIVTLDGKIIPDLPPGTPPLTDDKEIKKYPPFTLRTACVNVLIMQERNEQGRAKEITAKEKVERYELAKKIHKCEGLVDLQAEEIALLKKLIGAAYPPLTVGQAFEILDPHSEKK